MRTWTGVLVLLCVTGATLAEETPSGKSSPSLVWGPHAKTIGTAVAARKGKSVLSKLAASMKPGTWAKLEVKVPKGLWKSPPPSRGLHIAGWTDDAHWDSRTGQFLYMGLRQTRQFIAYSEEKNEWRVIPLDKQSDNPCFQSKFGHIYSSNGFDYERSRFYHRYNGFSDKKTGVNLTGGISWFDAVKEKWTKLPPLPPKCGFRGQAIEFFGAMDGLVALGTRTWIFSNKSNKWECLGASPVDGYHSLIRHNPYRREILMAGGNQQPHTVARITRDGKIEKLKDFPGKLSVRSDKFTVDPQTGRYLIFNFGKFGPKDDLRVYEFDSDKNEYRLVKQAAETYPYKSYSRPYSVCAFIPEYDVVMFANGAAFLYKPDRNAKYPVVSAAPSLASSVGAKKKSGKKK